MTLHQQLLVIRLYGVPQSGICARIHGNGNVQTIMQLVSEAYNTEDVVFPIDIRNQHNTKDDSVRQYFRVGDEDPEYKHAYLCERWALLNYLINATEDL
jgi:hypothetical protein